MVSDYLQRRLKQDVRRAGVGGGAVACRARGAPPYPRKSSFRYRGVRRGADVDPLAVVGVRIAVPRRQKRSAALCIGSGIRPLHGAWGVLAYQIERVLGGYVPALRSVG